MNGLAISPVGRELLDDPGADPAEVRLTLHHIARSNRWFGGVAAVRHALARMLPPGSGPRSLLDVGTGQGDIPRAVMPWAKHRGTPLRVIGLERIPAAARMAAGSGLPTVIGCGGRLPFPSRSVDVVVSSQLAHHLTPDACVQLFRESARVARIGVVVADLQHSRVARPLFRAAALLLRFDPWTRRDGVTSLARGFTPGQLGALISRAGFEARVARRPGFRVVAWWRVPT